jgi:hypothetical protein
MDEVLSKWIADVERFYADSSAQRDPRRFFNESDRADALRKRAEEMLASGKFADGSIREGLSQLGLAIENFRATGRI